MSAWLARRYLSRVRKKGFDLSGLGMFPDSALMPLRREGLDPVPELARLREREPISKLDMPFGVNVWLVSGYEEAKVVLGDSNGFSNDFNNLVGEAWRGRRRSNPGGLGFADPPVHTRLRKLLTPEFTMRRLARLKPGIASDHRGAAGRHRRGVRDGPVDLVQEFALPIPSLVICELLGVPYEDREDVPAPERFAVRPVQRRGAPRSARSRNRWTTCSAWSASSARTRVTGCSARSSRSTATRSTTGSWPGSPTAC